MFVKYSPKDVHELIFYYQGHMQSELLPEELESFFISWANRIPQRSISLTIFNDHKGHKGSLNTNDENMEIIKKYINSGVVKKFVVNHGKIY